MYIYEQNIFHSNFPSPSCSQHLKILSFSTSDHVYSSKVHCTRILFSVDEIFKRSHGSSQTSSGYC